VCPSSRGLGAGYIVRSLGRFPFFLLGHPEQQSETSNISRCVLKSKQQKTSWKHRGRNFGLQRPVMKMRGREFRRGATDKNYPPSHGRKPEIAHRNLTSFDGEITRSLKQHNSAEKIRQKLYHCKRVDVNGGGHKLGKSRFKGKCL